MIDGGEPKSGRPKSGKPAGGVSASATHIVKHSLSIAGHSTSVSLEEAFWDGLKVIAAQRTLSLAALVAEIDAGRGSANLSSALRVFVLKTFRDTQAQ